MGWDIDIKEKVYQRLANEIFFRIYNGIYQLGTKLPSYLNIAKEAGSSPETVRKAIRELQDCGLIEKTRLGFFVTSSEDTIAMYRQRYLTEVENTYKMKKQKVLL